MFKFINYFYTFSKLTTSFVLLGFLLVLGYALYISYKDVDQVAINLEQKFSEMNKEINLNTSKFSKIEAMIEKNEITLSKINDNITNSNENREFEKLRKENVELLKEIKIIKSQIKNILTYEEDIANNKNDENFNSEKIVALKNLIMLNYENGKIVNNEIANLQTFAQGTSSEIFEKLFLLDSKNFFGKDNLIKEFDLSVQKYVEKKFIEKNNNSVISFFLNYISIMPNDLDVYDNEDLNILLRAKNHLNRDEHLLSLNQVLSIESSEEYFAEWITQINLYIDFKKNIMKVNK